MLFEIKTRPFVETPIEASSPEEAMDKFVLSMDMDMSRYFEACPVAEEPAEEDEYEEEPEYKTPCDIPDEFGNHHCPYEDYGGYESERCRCMCGLGVDE